MNSLVKFSLVLAFTVILLGAYTRLTDAGLGCPDWPGCYGHLLVPMDSQDVNMANQAYPERPVETVKAWNEMVHRYFAGSLGIAILILWIMGLRQRLKKVKLQTSILLALVTFQAALGMWTVTMNLMPVVVMAHLLGGFSVFACLYWLHLTLSTDSKDLAKKPIDLRKLCLVASTILVLQIALGGWTSTNYASLACTELPICESGWQAKFDLSGAFSVPEADDYEFGVHNYGARMTMHVIHRFGAILTSGLLLLLVFRLYRRGISATASAISLLLLIQVSLGIANVVFSLPLFIAVAHNGVAALLLLSLVKLNFLLTTEQKEYQYGPNKHAIANS